MYLFSKQSLHYEHIEQYRDSLETFTENDDLLLGFPATDKPIVDEILNNPNFNITYKMYWKHDKYDDVVYEEEPELHIEDYTLNVIIKGNKFTLGLIETNCKCKFFRVNSFRRCFQ